MKQKTTTDEMKMTPKSKRAHHSGEWLEDRLRQDILDGKVLIGNRLLSSERLALYYSVDKMTANRVVQRLARDGLVRVQRGSGTFLNTPPITGTAGLLTYAHRIDSADVYNAVAREIRLHLQKSGCGCTVLTRDDGGDVPGDNAYGPALGRVTASKFALHIGLGITNREYYERLCWLEAPVLSIDFAPGLERVSSVSVDGFNAGYSAAQVLLKNGHKNLLFVPLFRGSVKKGTLHRELDSYLHECGWRYALESADKDVSCQYLATNSKSEEILHTRIANAFAGPNRPTAIFGTGPLDLEIASILKLGLKVPDDVSAIVSIWDETKTTTHDLDLTRFSVAWREMTREAVRILDEMIKQRTGKIHQVLVTAHFHEGQTVRSLRKRQ